eukprot:1998571-Amphidinium_carterae.1
MLLTAASSILLVRSKDMTRLVANVKPLRFDMYWAHLRLSVALLLKLLQDDPKATTEAKNDVKKAMLGLAHLPLPSNARIAH